jgi:hypothetical protein
MTSEGLGGGVFKGDSADTRAGKFPLVSRGGRVTGQVCAAGERGPPSAQAEFFHSLWAAYAYSVLFVQVWLFKN